MKELTGKANVLELRPDMTFSELKRKTEADNVKISENDSPSFKVGKSVFRETFSLSWRRFLPFGKKKPRNLILHLEGANSCFDLDITAKELESYKHHLWNKKEKEKFISKVIAKSKAEQKMISTTHFLILAIMLGVIVVLQFLIVRGLRLI